MRTRILLVEDNPDNRAIYRTILEHFGFDVLEAGDGRTGVRLAGETLPELILMDLTLPAIDGWEATRMLKSAEATRHIPIIALTAHALATDGDSARSAGCDGYLAKPVAPMRVVEEVRRFLGDGHAQG